MRIHSKDEGKSDTMKSPWIKTSEQLPPMNKYVIGLCNLNTWGDSDKNCHVVTVKRMIDQSYEEGGNNKELYEWHTFGALHLFGQDISHWMPIPELPGGIINSF